MGKNTIEIKEKKKQKTASDSEHEAKWEPLPTAAARNVECCSRGPRHGGSSKREKQN